MAYGTRRLNLELEGLFNKPNLNRINSVPHSDTYSLKSILIISSHLHLGLPKGPFPIGLPVKILKLLQPSSILAT